MHFAKSSTNNLNLSAQDHTIEQCRKGIVMQIYELDLAKKTAGILLDHGDSLQIEFDGESFKNGNGCESWLDCNVEIIKIQQFNEDDEEIENTYSMCDQDLIQLIKTEILERLNK